MSRASKSPVDRAGWPVSISPLGEEPPGDLFRSTTAEERLEMVRRLTEESWALAGRRPPAYSRADMPVRKLRRAGH